MHGYETTTVRMVAQAAGVSPGLVTRYFESKEALFLSTTAVGLDIAVVLEGPRSEFGARLAARIVDRWQREQADDPLLILLRAAGARPQAATALARFLERESTGPLLVQLRAYGLTEPQAVGRVAALEAFIMGAVMSRRILPPRVPETAEDLRTWLAVSLQSLLDHPSC